MNGIRDLAALAADDAAAERTIDQLPDAELFDLAAYAQEWDERAEAMEENSNRRALVWCVPVAVVSIAAIVWAWGV